MDDQTSLADRFEDLRPRLVSLAARVLDARTEAEEVVQDAWLRLVSVEDKDIANLSAWLSTVVARLAVDRLRQRRWRAETPLDDGSGQEQDLPDPAPGPEEEAALADAVGVALIVVLDRLGPAERMAFVLHDLFGLSFDEVASVVGRSSAAVRQLASRARRRVQAPVGVAPETTRARADLVAAFAKASREGRMEDLLRLLDPEVTLTLDPTALPPGMSGVIRGAATVAARARVGAGQGAAEVMLVDETPGLVVIATDGTVERILAFSFAESRITAIVVISDPGLLLRTDLLLLTRAATER